MTSLDAGRVDTHRLRAPWLSIAGPPVGASLVVLACGAVGRGIWLSHVVAIGLACGLAAAGSRWPREARASSVAGAIILLTLAGVAMPLLRDSPGPHRWVAVGPVNLYLAPLVLPSYFAACSTWARRRGTDDITVPVATLGVGLLLAAQPDASQVLALLGGSTVVFRRDVPNTFRAAIGLAALALITAWTFSRPDPLEPVPYVEGVFALALACSWWAGLAVIASAVALVIGLFVGSIRGPSWLAAVAVYYAALFGCSVAGLTPAPLIGYGAGPLLGFGVMVAVSQRMES